MKENIIMIRNLNNFCFNFVWPKDVDEDFKLDINLL